MSVRDIEVCKNGVIVTVSNGWFLCDEEDLDLVKAFSWGVIKTFKGNNTSYVRAGSHYCRDSSRFFHREVLLRNYCSEIECTDHINDVGFDNRGSNLLCVPKFLNVQKKIYRGFSLSLDRKLFSSSVSLNGKSTQITSKTEVGIFEERCNMSNLAYSTPSVYNPARDLRRHLDLLIREVHGVLTKEDVYFLRLSELAQNPWYILRYGLQEDCDKYNVTVPEHILDKRGFICSLKGIRLCPDLPKGFAREGEF